MVTGRVVGFSDSEYSSLLHVQKKMEMELKCPACSNLLKLPTLLPCDHVCCKSCVSYFMEDGQCVTCKLSFIGQDLRQIYQIQTIVTLFKNMNDIFAAKPLQMIEVPTLETTDIPCSPCKSPRLLCDTNLNGGSQDAHPIDVDNQSTEPNSGRGKKRQKLHSEPDEKDGKSSLRLEGKDGNDHGLATVSTLETIDFQSSPIKSRLSCDANVKGGKLEAQHINVDDEGTQHIDVGVEGAQHIDAGVEGAQHVDAEGAQHVDDEGAQHIDVDVEGAQHADVDVEGTQPICQSNLSRRGKKRQKLHSDPDNQVGESRPCLDGKDSNDDHGLANDVHKRSPNSEPKHHQYREIHFSNTTDAIARKCVFCQSSHVTEISGPMRYFSKGKSVVSKQSTKKSNVWHIHGKCFDWTPLVYFKGDIVKNLEAEVSRASKIKCSKCGKKGAALGCYKSNCQKSYHVPCAVGISNCRWDRDGYHLLCPAHISCKFPSDRSAAEKKVIDPKNVRDKQDFLLELTRIKHVEYNGDVWKLAPNITKDWVLCGSALSATENDLLEKLAKLTGSVVLKNWKENVTHVVAATDDLGGCSRTVKLIKATLTGKWILTIEWIKACLKASHPVAEDLYEITHDIHGVFDGPKTGRIRAMEKALPLFSGLSFCFSPSQFPPSFKRYLEDLITIGGGKIIRERDLCGSSGYEPRNDPLFHTSFFVYSLHNPDRCDPLAYSHLISERIDATEAIANKLGSKVIPHNWILNSLAACKIQSQVI